MQELFTNPLKARLKANAKLAGAWCQLASPMTAELLSKAGFDWLLLDLEHGPGDALNLISQIQAMASGPALPVVRAPWNDFVAIKRILDAGAYGVIIPYVNTPAEAQAAVRACKYPPQGIRGIAASPRISGYGMNLDRYLQRANDELLIITQVETAQAVDHLPEILRTEGLDGVFIGPMDLAASMGHLGNPAHPEVQATIRRIEDTVLPTGKTLCTLTPGFEQAKVLFDKGYKMVTLMADGVALAKTAHDQVTRFRNAYPT
jgi:2-dehydro-3-deoxyglucarate aldolase/4-hydroxy-2-oxoheptanedioate aldolase